MHQLAEAVRSYARRLHAQIGATHHIASPLGAWIVLALAASAAREPESERLAEVLEMPLPDASRLAHALLDNPPPAVAAAAAAWTAGAPTGAAAGWVDGLPVAVARGPVPNQAGADAWARKHTFGLIDRFPIEWKVWTRPAERRSHRDGVGRQRRLRDQTGPRLRPPPGLAGGG